MRPTLPSASPSLGVRVRWSASFATSFFGILGFGFGSRRGGLCTFGYVDSTLVKTGLDFAGFEIDSGVRTMKLRLVGRNRRIAALI